MDLLDAAILGLVEGLTEYLPVSSTGHLLVTQELLGIPAGEASAAYAICIQSGAILAVLLLYGRRFACMAAGLLGRDAQGARLVLALGAALLPALVVGGLAGDWFKATFFGPLPIASAWIAGGLLILAWHRFARPGGGGPLEALGLGAALVIGLAQCVAMVPGTSRSLVTILAGLGVGLSVGAAVEFSFLLGVLTLGAATAHEALGSWRVMLEAYGALPLVVGFAAACVTAMLAVRWMVGWLQRRSLLVFAWWRLLAGAALLAALAAGWSPAPPPT